MSKISAYFNRPAPFNSKPWVIVIVASLLVCFLIGFFQPFGIENFSTTVKCYVTIGFTLVTALSTSVVGYLLPFLFKKFYNPLKWTIGKNIANQAILILLIALGNFCFDWSIGHQPETFGSVMISYILVTLIIGFIPAMVTFFIVQNYTLKRNLNDAKSMNERLAERLRNSIQTNHIETNVITLSGNTKDTITLYPDSILYLESSGNYVKVTYLHDNVVKQKQIRTTIAQLEKDLQPYSYIVRCHRAYMVNTSFITNVEGNSLGFQLQLLHSKEEVPVSRTYLKIVQNKL